MNEKILFQTAYGSQVWKMDTPESDVDVWMTFQIPSKDILTGRAGLYKRYMVEKYPGIEFHELGPTCYELLQCNINYLVALHSPMVLQPWSRLAELRELSVRNLNKNVYHSVHGLAVHNYRKYVKSGNDNTPKRRATIIRVLSWGINALNGSGELPPFLPASTTDEDMIEPMIKVLDLAYERSMLPEKPQHEIEMMEWLYRRRLEYMGELY